MHGEKDVVLAKFCSRFKTNTKTGCWEWFSTRNSGGYAAFHPGKALSKSWLAHRYIWIRMFGEIPEGLVVDHLCRVRHCVNPTHMRIVTMEENKRAGQGVAELNRQKTCCGVCGHEYSWRTGKRAQPSRYCKRCAAARMRAFNAKNPGYRDRYPR